MDGMKLFWGLVIVLCGVVFIGVNIGWWNSNIWLSIIALWPLILIVIGLRLLIPDEKLLAAVLLGVVVLATLFVGLTYRSDKSLVFKNNEFMGLRLNTQVYSESLSDTYDIALVKKVSVTLSTGAARVNVRELPATVATETLYQLKSQNMGKISVDKTISGDNLTLVINESNVGLHLGNGMMTDRQIDLYLPPELVLDLRIDSGASKLNLDFSSLKSENTDLNIGASSGDIYLGSKVAKQTLKLDAGASSITFHVPTDLGLKATMDGGLNTVNSDSTLNIVRSGDAYVTRDFDSAANQMVITGSTGVSTIRFQK